MQPYIFIPLLICATLLPLMIDIDVAQREELTLWHSLGWIVLTSVACGVWAYGFSTYPEDSGTIGFMAIAVWPAGIITILLAGWALSEAGFEFD